MAATDIYLDTWKWKKNVSIWDIILTTPQRSTNSSWASGGKTRKGMRKRDENKLFWDPVSRFGYTENVFSWYWISSWAYCPDGTCIPRRVSKSIGRHTEHFGAG
ncbi:hypothetical protein FRC18_009457 [Serendipita sp. 400]|nr:hypothetical protein FRC18_009457 [Serendipita sp. 400]